MWARKSGGEQGDAISGRWPCWACLIKNSSPGAVKSEQNGFADLRRDSRRTVARIDGPVAAVAER